jgi:hypothetical protein
MNSGEFPEPSCGTLWRFWIGEVDEFGHGFGARGHFVPLRQPQGLAIMFDAVRTIDTDDVLRRMHDRLDAVTDMVDFECRLSDGIDTDPAQLDEAMMRCIDVVMAESTEWI